MRIPVANIVSLIAQGMSPAEIIKEYPDLEPEDIEQSLKYEAWLTSEEYHSLMDLA